MKDFKNDSTSTLARFGRDKRTRMTSQTAERVERRPRTEYAGGNDEERRYAPVKRASYNPNFTKDNRPVNSAAGRQYSQEGSKPYRKPYGENRFGGSSYGNRRDGDSYGNNRYGERKYNADRQPRKYYDENGDIDGNRADTPRTDSYRGRDNRPRTDYGKPYGSNRYSDRKPYGGKSFDKRGGNNNFRKKDDKAKSYPKYNPDRHMGEVRLNRFIAQSGICSRREADDYISAGLVSVNGVVVTELGTKVRSTDEVKFNDSRIHGEHKVYLVLNKPKGYVTSLDDPHADKTVMELVKGACTERIYPVGRLDKNSLGLLLFTNDGDLTSKLTHPALMKKKVYQVTLDKPLTMSDMEQIAEGIVLDDGEIHADEISYVSESKKEVGIEIHSGRNRIVRRIFEHLGYSVQKLDRVYYAGLTKKKLKRGAWRFLTNEEVSRLKSGAYE